ncbi:MAG: PSD1 and planctomycete cytochrome C domain-containing protein [Pirellula sp.]
MIQRLGYALSIIRICAERPRPATVLLAIASIVCCGLSGSAQSQIDPQHAKRMAQGLELFKAEVRPMLVGRCIKCHGGETTEGGLDLVTREGLLAGGENGKSIKIDAPSESNVIQLIRHATEPKMPAEGAKLTDRQIDALERWIGLGAPYDRPLMESKDSDPLAWTTKVIGPDARDFWTFQSLKNATPPAIEDAWIQNDIDRFVFDKLNSVGMRPNTRAEPRKLVRRAYLDALGVPPPHELTQEMENEVGWKAGDNWERTVDRVLSSEHFGERMARHWLDLARFAESFGFEQDYDRPHAYHYRDFLIRAFNRDLPYDQFAAWQIAGDELAPDNPDARLATGFLGAGVFPTQLTEKEFESARYDELDDMVSTLSSTFLGLTVGCARCHDHKYDPIPSRDYYQMVSVFRETIRSNTDIAVEPEEDQRRLERWEQQHAPIAAALERFEIEELPIRFAEVVRKAQSQPQADEPIGGWHLPASTEIASKAGAIFTQQADGSFLASGANADSDQYKLEIAVFAPKITGIRLDALTDSTLPKGGPGRAPNGNIGLSRIRVWYKPWNGSGEAKEAKLVNPLATHQQNNSNLSVDAALDDNAKTGWAIDPKINQSHSASFALEEPVQMTSGGMLTITLDFQVNKQHQIGRTRLSVCTDDVLPTLESDVRNSSGSDLLRFLSATGPISEPLRTELIKLYKKSDSKWQELRAAVQRHLQEKPKPRLVTAMICGEGLKPIPNHGDGRGFPHFYPKVYFLKRGDVNQKQSEADVGFLQALARFDSDNPSAIANVHWNRWQRESSENVKNRRASLAHWLTDVERGAGQQLARVMVNRVWQYHFGRGLVSTSSDFGFQGERPTHPELLDWLAQKLIDNGWRLKSIHKLIMMSGAYQQSSSHDFAKYVQDPKNQWLWRFAPRRLESEAIRDSVLSVCGQLDTTMYGPGSMDESMKRRSIYFFIKRSKLIPLMQVFDAPEPLVSVGSRPSTTVAPQALLLMNNTHVRSWVRDFAKNIWDSAPDSMDRQINQAFQRSLCRKPSSIELERSKEFVLLQQDSYQRDNVSNAAELALADLCQTLIGLNEFIYID